ncbi:hypothetical protein [Serratia liquefaciens]|uniref:hypothetical protein n=1 Tax=Serratia liquefaciens TaxID=614 RepID=UPI0021585EBC|nr:hypothetical protein [Serratia liquefaciens]
MVISPRHRIVNIPMALQSGRTTAAEILLFGYHKLGINALLVVYSDAVRQELSTRRGIPIELIVAIGQVENRPPAEIYIIDDISYIHLHYEKYGFKINNIPDYLALKTADYPLGKVFMFTDLP